MKTTKFSNSSKRTDNKKIGVPGIKTKLVSFAKTHFPSTNHIIIENRTSLAPLYENDYYVSPNFVGVSHLLVFTKINDSYYSFVMNKKSFQKNDRDIKLDPVEIRLGIDMYDGTVIDGVMISTAGEKKIFMANDVYLFAGSNQKETDIKTKLLKLSCYLEVNYSKDDLINTIDITTNKTFDLSYLNSLAIQLSQKSEFQTRGFEFIPKYGGNRLLFVYSQKIETPKISNKAIVHSSLSNEVKLPEGVVSKTFRIKKKDEQVYVLYLCKKEVIGSKNVIKYVKHSIAFLPQEEDSQFCESLFSNIELASKSILVDCIPSDNKQYWVPKKINKDKKIPDYV